jgi:hypothetical protein
MNTATTIRLGLAAWALGLSLAASAAPSLQAFTGVIGGKGNSSIPLGCTTYGPPPELSWLFSSAMPSIPAGGIAACGYSGGTSSVIGTVGPVSDSRSLAPVILGNPGFSGFFDGSAAAIARYGQLGAQAAGNVTAPPGNPVALFSSGSGAFFTDTFMVTSPHVVNTRPGFVRYEFTLDGSLAAPGAAGSELFGQARTQLSFEHGGIPGYILATLDVIRGSVGTVNNGAAPAGWLATTGSLSGAGSFLSLELPIVWGQAWEATFGLMTWAYGTADASFLTTARLTGFQFFDENRSAVTDFSVAAASGTNYLGPPIPEPSSFALLAAGLAALVLSSLRGTRRTRRAAPGSPAAPARRASVRSR